MTTVNKAIDMTAEKTVSTHLFVQEISVNEDFRALMKLLVKEAIDDKLETLMRRVEIIEGDIHELCVSNNSLIEANAKMVAQVNTLTNRIEVQYHQIDELQQNEHSNTLLVSGIPEEGTKENPENTNEVIRTLAREKLRVEIDERDIDIIHRTGKQTGRKPRNIVVKFTRHTTRHVFLKSRKNLKGTKIGIQEILSTRNQYLLDKARQLVNDARWVKGAWSWDGRICVLVQPDGQKEGKKVTVRSKNDLNRIYWEHANQHQLKDFDKK